MHGMDKVLTLVMSMRSPLLAVRGFEKKILGRISEWTRKLKKAGVLVLVTVRLVASAAPTLLSTLDNTPLWSTQPRSLARCPCNTALASGMRKFCGHVLQPLMKRAEIDLGKKAPSGWSVQSRLLPDFNKMMLAIGGTLEKLAEKCREKVLKNKMPLMGMQEVVDINSKLEHE